MPEPSGMPGQTELNPAELPAPRPDMRMYIISVAWQVCAHLLLPVFMLVVLLRSRREPLYRKKLSERFGLTRRRNSGAVLVFAASLGEVRAASPVIRLLLERGEHVLLTHSSPAGRLEGQRLFGGEITNGRITQAWMPLDLFWAIGWFLSRHRPRLCLVVEAELWPGLLMAASRRKVPMVQINGNYTEQGRKNDFTWRRGWRGYFWALYNLVLTKSEERATRYRDTGVEAARVLNVGELKFDLPVNATLQQAGERMRAKVAENNGRGVLTIASSVEAEEQALATVLTSFKAGTTTMPLIVWVPRSPQRFGPVADAMTAAGWRVNLRSEVFDVALTSQTDLSDCDILVGDSLGEMDFYYAISNITFVGATIAPHGGHNIIEPLALQRPVLTGPSLHGILYPALEAIDAGALISEPDEAALAKRLITLFNSNRKLDAFTGKTRGFNNAHKGAAARTVDAISPFLKRS